MLEQKDLLILQIYGVIQMIIFFFSGGRLNRNTGEWKVDGKVKCIVQKITYNDLPKLNAEGKLF